MILLMDREEQAAVGESAMKTTAHNSVLRLASAFSKGTSPPPGVGPGLGLAGLR